MCRADVAGTTALGVPNSRAVNSATVVTRVSASGVRPIRARDLVRISARVHERDFRAYPLATALPYDRREILYARRNYARLDYI